MPEGYRLARYRDFGGRGATITESLTDYLGGYTRTDSGVDIDVAEVAMFAIKDVNTKLSGHDVHFDGGDFWGTGTLTRERRNAIVDALDSMDFGAYINSAVFLATREVRHDRVAVAADSPTASGEPTATELPARVGPVAVVCRLAALVVVFLLFAGVMVLAFQAAGAFVDPIWGPWEWVVGVVIAMIDGLVVGVVLNKIFPPGWVRTGKR